MAIPIRPRQKKRDISSAATSLSKAIVSLIPSIISHSVSDIKKNSGTFLTNLIDAALAFNKDISNQLDFDAWDLVRASFASGFAIFMSRIELEHRPESKKLEIFVQKILERTEIIMSRNGNSISSDSLMQPMLILALRDATKCIALDLNEFKPKKQPSAIRKDFEDCMFAGMDAVRLSKPDLFKKVEDALSGAFSTASEKRNSKSNHEAFIVRGFTQIPIFGQEHTGVTTEDLYIKQRCLYFKKERIDYGNNIEVHTSTNDKKNDSISTNKNKFVTKLYASDMHSEIGSWLDNRISDDSIRVIAGGPGSGKSTFAKAIAIEVIDKQAYDVLFIPLQDIPSNGSFEQRIESLCHNRTELGFDRVDSPLRWLGRAKPDGSPPLKPLLLICDGLDEIAPPGSREAANITTDFIQALSTWVSARNSAGCYVKCIVLGRDGAAEEAFKKLNINSENLLYVGGLRPLTSRQDWQLHCQRKTSYDEKKLSSIDQRIEYWEKWAAVFSLDQGNIPVGLTNEAEGERALQELTAEPLLLYLLLWTDYLGIRWREAAENRNIVYQEIFNRIYRRDWGSSNAKKGMEAPVSGGHTTTEGLSPSEFMTLQEALGLSAWPSGGRIVSKKSFERTIKIYLSEDMFYDFNANTYLSLKSVALHSYTRSSEIDDSGYEFVHKSIGEYLIGRGLVEINLRALREIGQRTIDERCARIAHSLALIASLGILTTEIARFFRDEMALRFIDEKCILKDCVDKTITLTNWLLRNKFPISENHFVEKEIKFSDKLYADVRSIDVFWFFCQSLYLLVYNNSAFGKDSCAGGWVSGPIKISWPNKYSFCELFLHLSNRQHLALSERISTFNRLDLSGQILSDMNFGVLTYDEDIDGTPYPKAYLSFQSQGSRFQQSHFYFADLGTADMSMSHISDCSFNGSIMRDTNFSNSNFVDTSFENANFTSGIFSNCSFIDCKFYGINAWKVEFDGASFSNCVFGQYTDQYEDVKNHINCCFNYANFQDASFNTVDFKISRFIYSNFSGSRIGESTMHKSYFKNCKFSSSIIYRTSLSEVQKNILGSSVVENAEENHRR